MKNGVSFIVLLLIQRTEVADVKLPHVFSDNTGLQSDWKCLTESTKYTVVK